MFPEKIELNGKVITITEYCEKECPNRYDSECWSFCSLEMEMRQEDAWQYENDEDD